MIYGLDQKISVLKFIYSEKATKFCEIFTLLLSYVVQVKSKVKISQNSVAFSEYTMNFMVFRSKMGPSKVHIFWEGHKNLRNLHLIFDWHYIGTTGGDFTKFCGLLRIYEF